MRKKQHKVLLASEASEPLYSGVELRIGDICLYICGDVCMSFCTLTLSLARCLTLSLARCLTLSQTSLNRIL